MSKYSKYQATVIEELHPLFKGLTWVASARSEDAERYAITCVKIERYGNEWKIVATDGRRVHVSTYDAGLFTEDLDMLDSGLYEVIANTKKLIVVAPAEIETVYPNWQSIIPEPRPYFREVVCQHSITKIGIRTGALLDTDFMIEAVGIGTIVKKGESADIEYSAGNTPADPVMIRHEIGMAVIMPLKLGETEEQEAESSDYYGVDDLPNFAAAMESMGATVEVVMKKGSGRNPRKKQGSLPEVDETI